MRRKNNKDRLKMYFMQNPSAKLRVRGLERAAKLPLPSVTRYLKELIAQDIVQELKIGGATFYMANAASKAFKRNKILHNIKMLFESGTIDFLIEEFHNAPIRLFGSYAKGEDRENSDVDICVMSPIKKKIAVEKYEQKMERKIHLFVHKSLEDIDNKQLANNIINGLPLNGYIEVFS